MNKKHILGIFLFLICLCCGAACAQTTVTPFLSDMPDALLPAFAGDKWAGYTCIARALYISDTPGEYPAALVAMEKDEHVVLCGLEQRIGEPFRVYDVGTNALYQGRTPTITGAELRSFSVLYEIPGGYEEFRYCLIIGDNWRIRGYTRKEADGSELKLEIVSGQMTVTQTSPGSLTNSTQLAYPFSTRMRDVCADSIPTSLSGAQASVSAMPVFADDTAAVFSREMPVNLRQGSSTRTKSLGKYNGGTILRVSGFEGNWAKVQIGSSVGYMSIIYLQIPCSVSVLDETQLPTGKITGEEAVKLYEQANESSDILGEYESGQYLHVLATYGDWLQVCIPQGNMSWMMDQNGAIGYVRVQNVEIIDILP